MAYNKKYNYPSLKKPGVYPDGTDKELGLDSDNLEKFSLGSWDSISEDSNQYYIAGINPNNIQVFSTDWNIVDATGGTGINSTQAYWPSYTPGPVIEFVGWISYNMQAMFFADYGKLLFILGRGVDPSNSIQVRNNTDQFLYPYVLKNPYSVSFAFVESHGSARMYPLGWDIPDQRGGKSNEIIPPFYKLKEANGTGVDELIVDIIITPNDDKIFLLTNDQPSGTNQDFSSDGFIYEYDFLLPYDGRADEGERWTNGEIQGAQTINHQQKYTLPPSVKNPKSFDWANNNNLYVLHGTSPISWYMYNLDWGPNYLEYGGGRTNNSNNNGPYVENALGGTASGDEWGIGTGGTLDQISHFVTTGNYSIESPTYNGSKKILARSSNREPYEHVPLEDGLPPAGPTAEQEGGENDDGETAWFIATSRSNPLVRSFGQVHPGGLGVNGDGSKLWFGAAEIGRAFNEGKDFSNGAGELATDGNWAFDKHFIYQFEFGTNYDINTISYEAKGQIGSGAKPIQTLKTNFHTDSDNNTKLLFTFVLGHKNYTKPSARLIDYSETDETVVQQAMVQTDQDYYTLLNRPPTPVSQSYVDVVVHTFTEHNNDELVTRDDVNDYTTNINFLYYDLNEEKARENAGQVNRYNKTSYPIKVYLALDLFNGTGGNDLIDMGFNPQDYNIPTKAQVEDGGLDGSALDFPILSVSDSIFYYTVLQWGDEKKLISDDEILDSFYFDTYTKSIDDISIWRLKQFTVNQIKKLKSMRPSDTELSVHHHVYNTPGVKIIKILLYRYTKNKEWLIETKLLTKNIVINDGTLLSQDFSIFGGTDFNFLPLGNNEAIIGGLDEDSKYNNSVEKIKQNDNFIEEDYLERASSRDFIDNFNKKLYGESPGQLDLSTTRMFKKPLDIYDFITNDKQSIVDNNFNINTLPINSSATDIFISNNDCIVDLNPQDIEYLSIQNKTGIADKAILIGDYKVNQPKDGKIQKQGVMQTPLLEQNTDKQAF